MLCYQTASLGELWPWVVPVCPKTQAKLGNSKRKQSKRGKKNNQMNPQLWHKVAAISGNIILPSFSLSLLYFDLYFIFCCKICAINTYIYWFVQMDFSEKTQLFDWVKTGMAALGLGTYGAHVFKPKNPTYKEVIFPLSIAFLFINFVTHLLVK